MSEAHTRRDLFLFAIAFTLFAGALVHQVSVGAPLGPDEAIYASGGRELVGGAEASGFGLHRSIGMRLLAAPGLLFGDGEWALRSVAVLTGLLFLVAYRTFASRAAGGWPAAWAAAALVTSFGFQRRGGELLSDVPSLLLLVLASHVVLRELDRPGDGARPGPGLLLFAPLAAAAFYLRYGVTSSLAGIVGAAALVWWRPLARGWRVTVAVAALLLLLLLPHVLYSLEETGSALGILEVSADAAHRDHLGQGLVQFPFVLAAEGGPVLLLLLVIGAIYGARRVRRPRPEQRWAAFLWLASVFQIVATGLLAHAEFRYFFFGVAGLTLLGVRATVERVVADATGRRPHVIAAVVLLATFAVTHAIDIQRYRRLDRARQVEVEAGALVARAAGGAPCAVVTSEVPVVGWYSGCAARPLSSRPERLVGERKFLVLFARERRSKATLERLARSHRLTSIGQAADPTGVFGDAAVYQIH
jgi:4-amino-4-deoxy-L-arabinose transferase-like glycosyltransferase